MITTVLLLLHTTKCSGFLAKLCMLFTGVSALPRVLKVFMHSMVFMLHTLTVPSDEALEKMIKYKNMKLKLSTKTNLKMLCPSCEKITSFTKELWPLNSFKDFPDFKPCILQHNFCLFLMFSLSNLPTL